MATCETASSREPHLNAIRRLYRPVLTLSAGLLSGHSFGLQGFLMAFNNSASEDGGVATETRDKEGL